MTFLDNVCYDINVLKSFLYLFLVLNFASVQSLASVCKTKCSVLEISKSEKTEQSNEHESCHSTKNSEKDQNSDECGSICQADDLIQVDAENVQLQDILPKLSPVSKLIEITFLNQELLFTISTHDPPGHGFYSGSPIFIQKSSFLI